MTPDPSTTLIRHGETEFSRGRRYNGVTDAPLTDRGEGLARQLHAPLAHERWDAVLCSPLQRARRTAELAGFAHPEIVQELRECDYGEAEGLTTAEILSRRPTWDFWRDGAPGGESAADVAKRLEPVLARLRRLQGRTLLFSHSHTIRVLAARWLGLEASQAAIFALEPARISELGIHREQPILLRWNSPAGPTTIEEAD